MGLIDNIQEFFTKKKEEVIIGKNETPTENVSSKDFRPTYLDEKDKVEITPATAEQKLQYSRHIDGIEFTDRPSVEFPQFSQAQLNSVPDIIDGIPVNEFEKKMILLGSFEYSSSSNWSYTFSIDDRNKLTTTYHDIDSNNDVFEIVRHVSKKDVLFANQNEIELKIDNTQLNNIADKLNDYYSQIGESTWNFNAKEGKEILEFAMYLTEFPENVRNMTLDYLLLESPQRPNFHDYTEDMFNYETLYDKALDNYISKELPDYNYKEKSLSQTLNLHGIDSENLPNIKPHEVNYLNILLNDVTKILAENNKDLKKETTKLDSQIQKQISTESSLSIDNIYGFKPTDKQKQDLEKGKGITGEIKGVNYFIQYSRQEKGKGSLQILSIDKAKEFNLIPKNNNQIKDKEIGRGIKF